MHTHSQSEFTCLSSTGSSRALQWLCHGSASMPLWLHRVSSSKAKLALYFAQLASCASWVFRRVCLAYSLSPSASLPSLWSFSQSLRWSGCALYMTKGGCVLGAMGYLIVEGLALPWSWVDGRLSFRAGRPRARYLGWWWWMPWGHLRSSWLGGRCWLGTLGWNQVHCDIHLFRHPWLRHQVFPSQFFVNCPLIHLGELLVVGLMP